MAQKERRAWLNRGKTKSSAKASDQEAAKMNLAGEAERVVTDEESDEVVPFVMFPLDAKIRNILLSLREEDRELYIWKERKQEIYVAPLNAEPSHGTILTLFTFAFYYSFLPSSLSFFC
jgi:hypothetical protein